MLACLALAAADTHTGALEWWSLPVTELSAWGDAVAELQKQQKRKQ